jgi:hypothetical protein
MVKVTVAGQPATIDGYVWTSPVAGLADMLNAGLPWHGASPADGDPDLAAAQDAIAKFGGEILHADPVEYVEGRIY